MPGPTGRLSAAPYIDQIKESVKVAPPLFRGELPRKSLDLVKWRNPRYRGQLIGCCVGMSGAAMAETCVRTPEPLTEASPPRDAYDFSDLWVYYIARQKTAELGGSSIFSGEGAIVTHALQAVQERGFLPYDQWPSTDANYRNYRDRKPEVGPDAVETHKAIGDVRRLESPDQILEYLAGGYSVWIGLPWRGGDPDRDGYFAWGRGNVGGHAVELLGYDLERDRVKVGNSWMNSPAWAPRNGSAETKWSAMAKELTESKLANGSSEACVVSEVEGQWKSKVRSWIEAL
jgi:hypothetical protein